MASNNPHANQESSEYVDETVLAEEEGRQPSSLKLETTTASNPQLYFKYGDGIDSAEAYNSISVTSALVFGFAVTTFVTVEAGQSFGDNVRNAHIAFDILMALTIVLSALGFTVMSLQNYQVRRVRVMKPEMILQFLKDTFWYRHIARGTTWISLSLYLLGCLVYVTIIWRDNVGVAVLVGSVFGLGAVAVIFVWCKLNDHYMKSSGKKPTKQR